MLPFGVIPASGCILSLSIDNTSPQCEQRAQSLFTYHSYFPCVYNYHVDWRTFLRYYLPGAINHACRMLLMLLVVVVVGVVLAHYRHLNVCSVIGL